MYADAVWLLDRRATLWGKVFQVFCPAPAPHRALREHRKVDGDHEWPCLPRVAGVLSLERQEPVDMAGRVAAKLLRLLPL